MMQLSVQIFIFKIQLCSKLTEKISVEYLKTGERRRTKMHKPTDYIRWSAHRVDKRRTVKVAIRSAHQLFPAFAIDWFRVEHYECVYIEGVAAAKAAAGKLNHLFKFVDGLRMGDVVDFFDVVLYHKYYKFRESDRARNESRVNMPMTHTPGQKIEPREMCYICIANGRS